MYLDKELEPTNKNILLSKTEQEDESDPIWWLLRMGEGKRCRTVNMVEILHTHV
jgi:hypothetical protein